ncbi:MAG: FAD-binding protein [Clostridia bacterium]|nr:FAD-binding protein [Clostridia bacterium]
MEPKNTNTYDITIVGAGPAGSIFAREIARARPDLKILLIDGQKSTSAKPCGGLLAPDAQKLLAKFDLVLPKSILDDPQIFAVETIDVDQRLVRYYQRHYLNMDRYAFDQWLLSLVPSHVDIRKGRCRKIEKDGELFNVLIKLSDAETQVKSRIIVGADGGGSTVRRRFFEPIRVQYVAIQSWFKFNGQRMPYYSCVFDSKTSESCSWTIHKGDHIIFGGAFKPKGCREAFDAQRSRLENFLGGSFGDATKTEACLVSSPRSIKDFCTGKENIFLLGEAAGFISASSFEGFSSAMFSGKMLADAFARGGSCHDVQRRYSRSTRSLKYKLLMKSLKRSILCNPFARRMIMKSGIRSISPYSTKENSSRNQT